MKIWVNGRKLKCSEKGCKKKHAYTLEYTKHRDSHSYPGLACATCGTSLSGPTEYAVHLGQDHPLELALQETQPEDVPPPPAPPTFSSPAPSPAVSECMGASSPAMFPAPASQEPIQQVHTPMSAPPIMMASPQTILPPPSPQQPMSAPSSVQFTDEMDFAAINSLTSNMPILDNTVPDQINKESDEFMSILNDLNNCTKDYHSPSGAEPGQQQTEPLPPQQQQSNAQIMAAVVQQHEQQQQSNAQIMAELQRQQEGQELQFDNKLEDMMGPGGGGAEYQSPGPHPVILSPRSEQTQKPRPQDSAAKELQEMERAVGAITDQLEAGAPPDFQHYSPVYQEPPNQSPGVIMRVPQSQLASQQQQEFQVQGNPQQEEQNLQHEDSLDNSAYPTSQVPEFQQHPEWVQQHPEVVQQHPDVVQQHRDVVQQHAEVVQQHPEVVQQHPEVVQQHPEMVQQQQTSHQRHGSGNHPSAEVRAIVANRIHARKMSRSDSFDSRPSGNWTPPLTPQGPQELTQRQSIESDHNDPTEPPAMETPVSEEVS